VLVNAANLNPGRRWARPGLGIGRPVGNLLTWKSVCFSGALLLAIVLVNSFTRERREEELLPVLDREMSAKAVAPLNVNVNVKVLAGSPEDSFQPDVPSVETTSPLEQVSRGWPAERSLVKEQEQKVEQARESLFALMEESNIIDFELQPQMSSWITQGATTQPAEAEAEAGNENEIPADERKKYEQYVEAKRHYKEAKRHHKEAKRHHKEAKRHYKEAKRHYKEAKRHYKEANLILTNMKERSTEGDRPSDSPEGIRIRIRIE
jgi:hypothetical protein